MVFCETTSDKYFFCPISLVLKKVLGKRDMCNCRTSENFLFGPASHVLKKRTCEEGHVHLSDVPKLPFLSQKCTKCPFCTYSNCRFFKSNVNVFIILNCNLLHHLTNLNNGQNKNKFSQYNNEKYYQ